MKTRRTRERNQPPVKAKHHSELPIGGTNTIRRFRKGNKLEQYKRMPRISFKYEKHHTLHKRHLL